MSPEVGSAVPAPKEVRVKGKGEGATYEQFGSEKKRPSANKANLEKALLQSKSDRVGKYTCERPKMPSDLACSYSSKINECARVGMYTCKHPKVSSDCARS